MPGGGCLCLVWILPSWSGSSRTFVSFSFAPALLSIRHGGPWPLGPVTFISIHLHPLVEGSPSVAMMQDGKKSGELEQNWALSCQLRMAVVPAAVNRRSQPPAPDGSVPRRTQPRAPAGTVPRRTSTASFGW